MTSLHRHPTTVDKAKLLDLIRASLRDPHVTGDTKFDTVLKPVSGWIAAGFIAMKNGGVNSDNEQLRHFIGVLLGREMSSSEFQIESFFFDGPGEESLYAQNLSNVHLTSVQLAPFPNSHASITITEAPPQVLRFNFDDIPDLFHRHTPDSREGRTILVPKSYLFFTSRLEILGRVGAHSVRAFDILFQMVLYWANLDPEHDLAPEWRRNVQTLIEKKSDLGPVLRRCIDCCKAQITHNVQKTHNVLYHAVNWWTGGAGDHIERSILKDHLTQMLEELGSLLRITLEHAQHGQQMRSGGQASSPFQVQEHQPFTSLDKAPLISLIGAALSDPRITGTAELGHSGQPLEAVNGWTAAGIIALQRNIVDASDPRIRDDVKLLLFRMMSSSEFVFEKIILPRFPCPKGERFEPGSLESRQVRLALDSSTNTWITNTVVQPHVLQFDYENHHNLFQDFYPGPSPGRRILVPKAYLFFTSRLRILRSRDLPAVKRYNLLFQMALYWANLGPAYELAKEWHGNVGALMGQNAARKRFLWQCLVSCKDQKDEVLLDAVNWWIPGDGGASDRGILKEHLQQMLLELGNLLEDTMKLEAEQMRFGGQASGPFHAQSRSHQQGRHGGN
ncbi:uncharacterized protein JCM15063_002093 [Sporobolomyces koalae]|uniref:uncharacterized protein n=1 Tax=Sporobolomyces koalae TaxID=500713 RepID=UPI003171B411